MTEGLPTEPPEKYRAVALAAAFLKHECEGNTEGLQTIIDEVTGSGGLADFIRGLSGFAITFGERHWGDNLATELQAMALDCQRLADQAT